MKKLIALILAVMMLLSLVACGEVSTTENDKDNKQSQGENKNEKPTNQEEKKEISFTEMTVVDNDECLIKITGINTDNTIGYVELQLENKSTEKNYYFAVDNAYINGVQCNPYFTTNVAAGRKSDARVKLANDLLKKNDIGDFTDIELSFRVYDIDNSLVVENTVHIYPYGEDKVEHFDRQPQVDDNVVMDNENATVIVTGYEEDEITGYTVNLFFVNKSDKELMFMVSDSYVNEIAKGTSRVIQEFVAPGNCMFGSISWSDIILKQHNINEVEEIEFLLLVDDREDWNVFETITLNP